MGFRYHSLKSLSEKFGYSADDIINLGVDGMIKLWVHKSFLALTYDDNREALTGNAIGFFFVPPHTLGAFLAGEEVECPLLFKDEKTPLIPQVSEFGIIPRGGVYRKKESTTVTVKRSELQVRSDDIAIIEEEYLQHDQEKQNRKPRTPANNQTAEKTDLKIIGALLSLLNGLSGYDSEASIIDAITDRFEKERGLGKRTLEDRFAKAKKALGLDD